MLSFFREVPVFAGMTCEVHWTLLLTVISCVDSNINCTSTRTGMGVLSERHTLVQNIGTASDAGCTTQSIFDDTYFICLLEHGSLSRLMTEAIPMFQLEDQTSIFNLTSNGTRQFSLFISYLYK